jgi:hypothetical protein
MHAGCCVDADAALELVLDLCGGEITGYEGRLLSAATLQANNSDQLDMAAPTELSTVARHPQG